MAPKSKTVKVDPRTGQKVKEYETIIERYDRIRQLFEGDDRVKRDYRAKLFGHNVIDVSTERYNILTLIKELGISKSEWDKWDIHDKAQFLAQKHLQNMVDIVNRHVELQTEIKKKYNAAGG